MAVNKADIQRTKADDHPAKGMANDWVKRAGMLLKPFQFDYQGSITLHYYRVPNTNDFAFIAGVTDLSQVDEGQADVGLKELKRVLMQVYDREVPRESH